MPGAFGPGQANPLVSPAFLTGCIFIARDLNPLVKKGKNNKRAEAGRRVHPTAAAYNR
jgi:hypothetical protein